MSDVEQTLKHVVDRDEMHRLIDALEPGQQAVLVTQVTTLEGQSVQYYHVGALNLWAAMGMLETAKLFIFDQHLHADEYEEEA